jgi:hypothetical protein
MAGNLNVIRLEVVIKKADHTPTEKERDGRTKVPDLKAKLSGRDGQLRIDKNKQLEKKRNSSPSL